MQWYQEETGVLAVKKLAHDAGWISRDQTRHDFGVDLHFEVAGQRGEATGRLIAVQVKSGASYFARPTRGGWWYYPSDQHRRYWLNHSLPVVLALHDDRTGLTYWAHVAPESMEPTAMGGSKILIPAAYVLDEHAFIVLRTIANRPEPVSTGAFLDTPTRHRMVLASAMEGAARDDARLAFEHSRSSGRDLLVGGTYHMGDPMGRYVLTAYREFGEFLALRLVVEHLTFLNRWLEGVGKDAIGLTSLLAGLHLAMPGDTTTEELQALKAYITVNAAAYWGSPL